MHRTSSSLAALMIITSKRHRRLARLLCIPQVSASSIGLKPVILTGPSQLPQSTQAKAGMVPKINQRQFFFRIPSD
jgi:hypothetical protein